MSIKPVGLQDWVLQWLPLCVEVAGNKRVCFVNELLVQEVAEVVIPAFTEELQKELNAILGVEELLVF